MGDSNTCLRFITIASLVGAIGYAGTAYYASQISNNISNGYDKVTRTALNHDARSEVGFASIMVIVAVFSGILVNWDDEEVQIFSLGFIFILNVFFGSFQIGYSTDTLRCQQKENCDSSSWNFLSLNNSFNEPSVIELIRRGMNPNISSYSDVIHELLYEDCRRFATEKTIFYGLSTSFYILFFPVLLIAGILYFCCF